MKKQKVFYLKVILVFFVKTKVKTLVLWENNDSHICSSIHDLWQENYLVKQPTLILDISEGNSKTLFFIIDIRALLGCFLPFRWRRIFLRKKNKQERNFFFLVMDLEKLKKING